MAGSAQTSGYDVSLQINANSFAAAIEAAPQIRSAANLRLIPLGDPSAGPPTTFLQFTPPLEVRFYRGTTPGDTFELDVSIRDAQYVGASGESVSLGSGRTLFRVPAQLQKQAPSSSPDGLLHILLLFNWASAEFLPLDTSSLPSGVTAQTIRDGLIAFFRARVSSFDLTGSGVMLAADTVPDPPPGQPPVTRDIDVAVLRGSGSTADAIVFPIRLLRASRGSLAGLRASGSAVGPLEGGALVLNNLFVFTTVATGLGIPPGRFTIDTPPTTLTILSGTVLQGATVNNFTLTATGSALTVSAELALPVPGYRAIFTVNGPVTFALSRGGMLVAGANLTSSVSVTLDGWGIAAVIGLAIIGAVVGLFTAGTGAAGVAIVGAGIGATVAFFIARIVDEILQAFIRAFGPQLQLGIERAFGSSGGTIIPAGLLAGLGGSLNFEPPILFDDLRVGLRMTPLSAPVELRRVSGVSVPNEAGIDLDTGVITLEADSGLDLVWDGGILRPSLGASMAGIRGRFHELTHTSVVSALAISSGPIGLDRIPIAHESGSLPEPLLLAVRTNRLRHAKLAVWRDLSGDLLLRYVLYDDLAPNLRILSARPAWRIVESIRDADSPGSFLEPPARNYRDANEGVFRALHHRLGSLVRFSWSLDGVALREGIVSTLIRGSVIRYSVSNEFCSIRIEIGGSLTGVLRCEATDSAGIIISDELPVSVSGNRRQVFGRSGLQMQFDELEQLVIHRQFRYWGDVLPDPPPDYIHRITEAGIELVARPTATQTMREVSLDTQQILMNAENAMRTAAAAEGVQVPNLRIR